jgi:hypothetical protein
MRATRSDWSLRSVPGTIGGLLVHEMAAKFPLELSIIGEHDE